MIILILILTAVVVLMVYCRPAKGIRWYGVFYPAGNILDEKSAVKSQVFTTYLDCKAWAEARLKSVPNPDARAVCAKNCMNPNDFTVVEDCEEIIRSWRLYPNTITFGDNFQE
jgi:hypothetical protein